MKKTLLIIDPQVDFCMPGGALYVKNADVDMQKLSSFITENAEQIDSIIISLDMHNLEHIAHSIYWVNSKGEHPAPFTSITLDDVKTGVWKANNPKMQSHVLYYLEQLESNGNFTHTIWPNHCIAGTQGSNIFPPLLVALKGWMEVNKKTFTTYIKGMNPTSEQFGIFKQEVKTGDDEGEFNHNLFYSLFGSKSEVLVSGQAKSHCVATSLKQIAETHPDFVKQITLLSDTTSNVVGCENIADEIYKELRELGMDELTTLEIFKK